MHTYKMLFHSKRVVSTAVAASMIAIPAPIVFLSWAGADEPQEETPHQIEGSVRTPQAVAAEPNPSLHTVQEQGASSVQLFSRVFSLQPSGLERMARKYGVKTSKPASIFRAAGIALPKGATFHFDARKDQLVVRTTVANMKEIEKVLKGYFAPGVVAADPGEDATPIRKKLAATILEGVTLTDASLEEAIAEIQTKAEEQDPFFSPARFKMAIPDTKEPLSISVDLPDLPVHEALRLVTGLAGVTFRIRGSEVVIVPAR